MGLSPQDHLSLTALIAWRAGELEPEEEEDVEAHFFECDLCARRLEEIERLGRAVVELVHGGRVSAAVTASLLEEARARGLAVRTYHLAPGEEVKCTAAPEDDFVVVRLAGDFGETDRVDVDLASAVVATGETDAGRIEDVAVDRESGEIVLLYAAELVRSLPRSRWRYEVRAKGPEGERALGPYRLDHTPWQELVH